MSLRKPLFPACLILLVVLLAVPVGATTVRINATYDGELLESSPDAVFPTQRNGVGDAVLPMRTDSTYGGYSAATNVQDIFTYHMRTGITIPTSSLEDDAVISSAVLSVSGWNEYNSGGTVNFELIDFTPVNSGEYAATDYSQTTFTPLAPNITYAAYVNGWNNFTLNAVGLSKINKTANSTFLFDHSASVYNQNLTWANNGETGFRLRPVSLSGGAFAPFLTITYSLKPVADFTADQVTGTAPLYVQFTDASTNESSSWEWDFGDGNTSTEQNPLHAYAACTGTYTVSLKSTNLAGNDTETKTDYIETTACSGPQAAPMGTLYHNTTYLNISTYEGSGELTHPNVIYTETPWNGYTYLMAMSPYPGGHNTWENPSMRYSNDGFSWEQIAGQPDPIIGTPDGAYNSDPNIYLNGSTLYLFNRWTNYTLENPVYWNRTTTTNGVAWTTEERLTFPYGVRSASFIYNGTGWECWANRVTTNNLTHFHSDADGLVFSETGTTTGVNIGSHTEWHSEVKYYDNQYQLLSAVGIEPGGLYFFNSTNGLNWVASPSNPVMIGLYDGKWDERLYKSSFVEKDNWFRVWYAGWNYTVGDNTTNHVGYTQNPIISVPVASFTTNTTSGTVPLAVQFTDSSTNTPTGWNWSFGDGNWNNGTNGTATHLYESAGMFDALLIASNGGGSSTSATTAITVNALPVSLQCQNQTGNITINLFSNSTSTLGWNWQDPGNITQIAEDGLFVTNFDNSSDYFIGTGYLPESWHKLKIYNATDFGQLNCTTDAVPVTPTPIPMMPSTESTAGAINPMQYWWIGAGALGLIILFKKW